MPTTTTTSSTLPPQRVVPAIGVLCFFFLLLSYDYSRPSQTLPTVVPARAQGQGQGQILLECRPRRADNTLPPLEQQLLFPQPKTVHESTSAPVLVSVAETVVFRRSNVATRNSAASERFIVDSLQRWCVRSRSHRAGTTYIDIDIAHSHEEERWPDGALSMGDYRLSVLDTEHLSLSFSSRSMLSPLLSALSQLLSLRPVKLRLPLHVEDSPKYAWRGLLVDVARHFIPIKQLKRCVDAMEAVKLNVLHLHLTDTTSFPLLLRDVKAKDGSMLALSQLALLGAFDNKTKIYTADDLRGLVQYAAHRNVIIVPEVDMPAHSRSWGHAFPQLILPYNASTSRVKTLDMVPLDVSQPVLLPIVKGILVQLSEIFPSKYLHIGGDEVRTEPWLETPHVMEWLARQKRGSNESARSYNDLFLEFETDVFAIVRELGRVPLVWQGVVDAHAMPASASTSTSASGSSSSSAGTPAGNASTIVQPWKCWGGLALRAAENSLREGHGIVMSSCWYLDSETDWLTFVATDQSADVVARMFKHRNGRGAGNSSASTSSGDKGLLGGEASMWTEKVDATNFECRVWPRAAAIAARLWGFGGSASSSVPSAIQELTRIKRDRGSSGFHQRVNVTEYDSWLLHSGFVHAREQIVTLGVAAAELVFHYVESTSSSSTAARNSSVSSNAPRPTASKLGGSLQTLPLKTITATSEDNALELLRRFKMSQTLTSDENQQPPVLAGGARLTSQCSALPQEVQRPLTPSTVKIAQLNAADGSLSRTSYLTRWLRGHATRGVVVCGFCELNGWHTQQSSVDLSTNLPLMQARAAEAGFAHSHITVTPQHPYHLGIMSALPFKVVREIGPPVLQRGMLLIYIERLKLYVAVLHLHAHDSTARERECQYIAEHVLKPLLLQDARVVLMGDFNTLSAIDAAEHEAQGLVQEFSRSDNQGYARLRKKFTLTAEAGQGGHGGIAIDYKPMATLLATGMRDSCAEACLLPHHALEQPSLNTARWSSASNDSFSACMSRRCGQSMPTRYSAEWANVSNSNGGSQHTTLHPPVRVDFALLSPAIVRGARAASASGASGSGAETERAGLNATLERTELTGLISDHYPVLVEWREMEEWETFRV